MKKIFLILCTLGMLLIFGCGKEKTGTENNPYNIVWYSFGNEPDNLKQVLDKVNEYTKKKIGVTIELKMLGVANYSKKIQLIEASGEPYDLCFTCSWVNDYRLNASKGYFYPLNDAKDNLLKKYGKGIIKVLNPLFLEGTKINGINYAVPTNKEIAYQTVYRFNKKYVDKYGFDISKVKLLEDLEPMLKIIKQKEPGVVPFAVYPSDYLLKNIDYIIRSSLPGAVIIKEGNHKVINQFKLDRFLKHMETYHKYYESGYIPKDVALLKGKDTALEKSGKWFCDIGGYQPGADKIWSRSLGFKVESVPAFTPPIVGSTSVAGAMIAISSTSERPDLCMKFLNLLNTDKYLRNLLGYGIEGVNYKKISDNVIEKTDVNYDIPQYTLGNMFITYLFPDDPKNKWEMFKEWNASAVKSPILGFTFNPEPVKSELSAMTNVSEQYGRGLLSGAYSPKEYLPIIMKKFKAAGMEKILTEMQKQVDEWHKKQVKNE